MFHHFNVQSSHNHSARLPLKLAIVLTLSLGFSLSIETAASQEKVTVSAEIEAEASKRVNRLSDELKSPFCPGKTLLNCTSYQAFALRKEMTEMILAGKSDEEILNALRESFGEILENPPQPWYTILVPIMPFILGAMIAVWMFSRWLGGSRTTEQEHLGTSEDLGDQEEDHSLHHDRLQALLRDED